MQLPQGPLEPHALLLILYKWHLGDTKEHPIPFPGPLASRTELVLWLKDVREKCEKRGIHPYHQANAVISWLPKSLDLPQGTKKEKQRGAEIGKFRAQVTKRMRQVREWPGWLYEGRYWKWIEFREEFLKMCENEESNRKLGIAGTVATAAGGVVLLPIMGTALLGAVGFTAEGVAAGSIAAGAQSTFYGGATGGLFSLLQSAGATAVAPAIGQVIAGVGLVSGGVGSLAVATLPEKLSIEDDYQNYAGVLQVAVNAVGDIGDLPLFTS